jgi:hypothetical protein
MFYANFQGAVFLGFWFSPRVVSAIVSLKCFLREAIEGECCDGCGAQKMDAKGKTGPDSGRTACFVVG